MSLARVSSAFFLMTVSVVFSRITSKYYGHWARRIAPFFLPGLRYWHIQPRRDRDHKLSYILNVTSGNSTGIHVRIVFLHPLHRE